jgi:hypothetical protein
LSSNKLVKISLASAASNSPASSLNSFTIILICLSKKSFSFD